MNNREEFLKKIRATFKIEATEGIANITSNLIELEKKPPEAKQAQLIEAIFREAHSLKGAARAVNITEIETICQAMESVFSALKNKTIALDSRLFDLFHLTVNTLSNILEVADQEIPETLKGRVTTLSINLLKVEAGEINEVELPEPASPPEAQPFTINDGKHPDDKLPQQLQQDHHQQPQQAHRYQPTDQPQKAEASRKTIQVSPAVKHDETIRISVEKLDNLLFQSEEMLALKQTFDHVGEGLRATVKKLNSWSYEASEVSLKMEDYVEWTSSLVKTVEADLEKLRKFSMMEAYNSGAKIESLLDEVKKMISVPVSTILDVFPKAARDMSKDKGKEVSVAIRGEEIEVDRRILEEIRNPLMHLLRNCVDHGIEKPQIRKQKNKPEKGLIQLIIDRMENNMVEITIADDGAGIDMDKLMKRYLKQEKIPASEASGIKEQTLLNYIFKSGISTSDMITDLSGRGLGLAIVQEKIEQLGGSVSVKTTAGKGTEFRIQIPLALVTFRGVRVLLGEREYIVPTSKIDRVLRLDKSAVKTVENKETIPYNGEVISLVHLSDLLEMPFKESEGTHILALVFCSLDEPIGFAVDEILDEEVVLVKKFNNQLKRVRNVAGATVLGSGKVIPILNVSDLLKSAVKETSQRVREKRTEKEKEMNTILVVEDSITSRMLLKNILETAGYKVSTAIDGVEGYTKLKEEPFDLIVSDVDMPRMNGFDMTAKIRSDKALAELPIVLVTSLSKKEDRERGMEVGANAYIVKSSFDQSNLLEVVERLL